MRLILALVLALLLVAAGCGGGGDATEPADEETADTTRSAAESVPTEEDVVALARRPAGEEGLRVPARRARIVAATSDFGRILFDANGQVVYVFEVDESNTSNCTSADCVEAWPPVLTEEQPSAGAGVEAALLGTIRRDDGALQVTYDGRPLYFYEHEGPREIRCHNVNLHGGLWWVVAPDGDPVA